MPEVKELIKQYGQMMYMAGVHEKEPDHVEHLKKADDLLQTIIWLVSEEEI